MELLLNLLWLTLTAPAIWLWRRERLHARNSRYLGRLRPLMLLGCILVLLLPIVSATDDLHAMRSEIEESVLSKSTVKHSAAHKAHSASNGGRPSLAQLIYISSSCIPNKVCGQILPQTVRLPAQARLGTRTGRAPPSSHLR